MKKLLPFLSFIGFFFLTLFFSSQKASAETLYVYFGSNNRSNIIWQVGFRVIMNYDDFSDRRYTSTYKTLVNSTACSGWNRCGGATIYPSGPQTWRIQWGTACIDPVERIRPFPNAQEANSYSTERINVTDNTDANRDDLDWFSDSGGGTLWFAGYTTTRNCPNKPDPRYRIQGQVFVDKNSDGNKDTGEPWWNSATGQAIELWGDAYDTTGTNSNGYYEFYNLPARDDYGIRLNVPNGYRCTTGDCRVGCQSQSCGSGITLGPNRTYNFGIALDRGAISGIVFVDEQPNGKANPDGNDTRLRNETVRIDPNGANDTRKTDRDGIYRFDDLNPGSDHTIRLEGIDTCRLNIMGDNPKLNVNAPAGGNNTVHFRLTRRYFEISGNIYKYEAGVCEPTINTGCQSYERSVKITAVGTGRNDDSRAGDNPDYTITKLEDQNSPYTVRLTGLRPRESVVGGRDKDVSVNCADAVQDFFIRPAGASNFSISGAVYVESGKANGLQKTGVNADDIYDGGGTIQIRNCTNASCSNTTASGRTGPVRSNGTYQVDNNPLTNDYRVRLLTGSLANGYTINGSVGNNLPINNPTGDVSNINFLLNAPAANTYSIQGGVYVDSDNPEGKKTNSEPYVNRSGNEEVRIVGLDAGNSSVNRTITNFTNTANGFSSTNLPVGRYRVEFSGPNGRGAGWRVTYPSGISPYRIATITLGPSCNDSATDQDGVALCTAGGSVTNVDFGIKQQNDDPWYQSVGGDIRVDEDNYRNIIPDGITPVCSNSTYPYVSSDSISGNLTSGVVFTGNNPNLSNTGNDRSKASNRGWLVTGNKFSPVKPGTIRTSYTYMNNIIERGRLTVNPMFGNSDTKACTSNSGPDCTFRANLLNGVYKSTSQVKIRGSGSPETYTFPDGRDYVFLIEDNLRIESNIKVNPGSTVTFIVSGDIIISPDVTELDGIYSADGSFITQGITTGANDTQLTIEGNVIVNAGLNAGKRFDQRRDLGDTQNAVCPAVRFVTRPDFILNGPELLRYTNYVIQEIAPGSENVN